MSVRLLYGLAVSARVERLSFRLLSRSIIDKGSTLFHKRTVSSATVNAATNNHLTGQSSSGVTNSVPCVCLLLSSRTNYSTSGFALEPVKNRTETLTCSNEIKRSYAKGRDKVKSKKANIIISEDEIGQVIDITSFKFRLDTLLNEMKEEFTKSLSVRGAAGNLETLQVDFDGGTYALQELAQVGRKNPQMAVLNLSSLPEACEAVMRAIYESGMNINPQQEGTTIYVPLPKVTREHRENLAKSAKALFTKYKVLLQGVQNHFVREARKQSELSEDLLYSVEQQIMKLTGNYISDAEKLMLTKQKELLDTK